MSTVISAHVPRSDLRSEPMATQPLVSSRPTYVEQDLEAHRVELTGYCYRMLGSGAEAEDAVQETMVRAWRAADRFEGRSSVRTWLYRIATNVCTDMHRSPQRRARPMDLGPATPVAGAVPGIEQPESTWVQPIADSRVLDATDDPAELAAGRETIRLAFVATLQHLPPQQRAVLILREVLRWQATEVAELLDISVAAVNSSLQRARATLSSHSAESLDSTVDPEHEALLARYLDAFERYDIAELVGLLRKDAVLSMPPYPLWLRGAEEIGSWFGGQGIACKGSRLLPVAANGTAGFGSYKLTRPGLWEPWSLQVVEVRGGAISGHHNFLSPELFAEFALPSQLTA